MPKTPNCAIIGVDGDVTTEQQKESCILDNKPALVLLSGGLDSVTALAWARQQDYALQEAISFSYGQRHIREIESASSVATHYKVAHRTIALTPIEGSHLTDLGDIRQGRDLSSLEEIAPTYVPNRNMILLSYAATQALLSEATNLIGGWNAADALNYPDCQEDFIRGCTANSQTSNSTEF